MSSPKRPYAVISIRLMRPWTFTRVRELMTHICDCAAIPGDGIEVCGVQSHPGGAHDLALRVAEPHVQLVGDLGTDWAIEQDRE